MIASEMGAEPKISLLPKFMLLPLGLFIPIMKEMREMIYQYDRDYFFDSSKFTRRFNIKATPYEEGVKTTCQAYKQDLFSAYFEAASPAHPPLPESDQHLSLFIPQPEHQRLEGRPESNRLDLAERRVLIIASLQVIIGNKRTEVVDMMITYVTRKPVKYRRELEERASVRAMVL